MGHTKKWIHYLGYQLTISTNFDHTVGQENTQTFAENLQTTFVTLKPSTLMASGKPSTWLPLGGLVEQVPV